MKITNEQLRRIVKEELEAVLQEAYDENRKYVRRQIAGTTGPKEDPKAHLVLISFGKKEGVHDVVKIPLKNIYNRLENFKGHHFTTQEAFINNFEENLNQYQFFTQDSFELGVLPELKAQGVLPHLDENLLVKKLTDSRATFTNGGRGAPKTLEHHLPPGASLEGDETTKGNRVTIDDPTME